MNMGKCRPARPKEGFIRARQGVSGHIEVQVGVGQRNVERTTLVSVAKLNIQARCLVK